MSKCCRPAGTHASKFILCVSAACVLSTVFLTAAWLSVGVVASGPFAPWPREHGALVWLLGAVMDKGASAYTQRHSCLNARVCASAPLVGVRSDALSAGMEISAARMRRCSERLGYSQRSKWASWERELYHFQVRGSRGTWAVILLLWKAGGG